MIVRKGESEPIIAKLKEKFISEHKDFYSEGQLEYIEEYFWDYVFSNCAPDLLMQIYYELELISSRGNFYDEHIKRIGSIYGFEKDILDVASGIIPSFANGIAKEQLKISKGTITIYEPLLGRTTSSYPNMKLHKEAFSKNTNIEGFDLITGILPCEATEDIIVNAISHDKDFYIAMCGCNHLKNGFYSPYDLMSRGPFQQYIIEMAESLLQGKDRELVVDRLDDSFMIDYPILYTKKK